MLWADINTYGEDSLYKNLFLNRTVLEINEVYKEDGYGNYLSDNTKKLFDFKASLQAALNLTADDLDLIIEELGFDNNTVLSIVNISKVYRYGYLARKFPISVEELIDLKDLSGIDPFVAVNYEQSGNFRTIELIRFIALVQRLQNADFTVQDLNYLFKHEDETGNSQPDTSSNMAFARSLHSGLKEIEKKYPIGGDLTKEQAKNLVTSIYGQEHGEVVYPLLKGSATFTTSYDHNSPPKLSDITDITEKIAYDDLNKQLSFQGLVTEQVKNDLQGVNDVSREFKNAVNKLYDQSQAEYRDFFDAHPKFEKPYKSGKTFKEIIEGALNTLVDELQEVHLKQVLSENLELNILLIDALLQGKISDTGKHILILHAQSQSSQPVIRDFLNISENGVSAAYYDGDSISGSPAKMTTDSSINFDGQENELPQNTSNPGGNISVEWEFYLESTTSGNHNLYLDTDANSVLLWINGKKVNLEKQNQNGDRWENTEVVAFEAGKWKKVKIQATELSKKAVFKWRSKNQLITTVPSSQLFPQDTVRNFIDSYVKLLKTVRTIEGLSLGKKEVEYFADHKDFRINDEALFEALPVKGNVKKTIYQSLTDRLDRLIGYTELKNRLSTQDTKLVEIFDDPTVKNENEKFKLLQIKDWDESQLESLIQHFTGNTSSDTNILYPHLSDMTLFKKVVATHELASDFRVSVDDLLDRTTNDPEFEQVNNMQSAIRSNYDQDNWLEVIRPINDRMRERKRDALVSTILFELSKDDDTKHIDTADKLFEFFLIDVQMGPCRETSRIKQAISSVQLFVQRCLLNLENEKGNKGVDPADINSEQWSWMKNYRVWEANRKVFLYPENWLEPSLRTDKSPFFKEFEGELLQSDIDMASASTAMLNYLEKLDKVAQLSICGMCRGEDENDLHVVGKVSGKSGDYYHREFDGSTWTPWQKIDLDIEEGPVIPVFWKGSLLLFWTSVMQKGQDEGQVSKDQVENPHKLSGPPEITYEVNLCWSEFYNGKWQTKRTSDFDEPAVYKTSDVSFKKNLNLIYGEYPLYNNYLIVYVRYSKHNIPEKDKYENIHELIKDNEMVKLESWPIGSFLFYTKYSEPSRLDPFGVFEEYLEDFHFLDPFLSNYTADGVRLIKSESKLSISYWEAIYKTGSKRDHNLIEQKFDKINDMANIPRKAFSDPFFVQDFRHLFFVEVDKEVKYESDWPNYGMEVGNKVSEVDIEKNDNRLNADLDNAEEITEIG